MRIKLISWRYKSLLERYRVSPRVNDRISKTPNTSIGRFGVFLFILVQTGRMVISFTFTYAGCVTA